MSNFLSSHETKSLLSFAKDSAKKSFQDLRKKEHFHCNYLEENIKTTKLFFQHTVFKDSASRTPQEIMERILIFPFLAEIIKEGIAKKTENSKEGIFYKISKQYEKYALSVIVLRNQKEDLVLLSCFKNFDSNKKKNRS